jgi:hypothetical protein
MTATRQIPTTGMKVRKARELERVVAAYPRRSEVSGRFMACYDAMRSYDMVKGQRICAGGGHIPLPATIIASARNQICRTYLDEHDADWLWFIDTDMTFPPEIVDRLVHSAHPRDRPIMGALCFSITDDFKAAPTIYVVRPDQKIGRVLDYPRNQIVRAWTGTGCLLIHRDVLERMREKWPKPWEWFVHAQIGDEMVGEDITFCARAEELGIPVHVDTSIKCGHEKPVVIDEAMFDAQQGPIRPPHREAS